MSGFSFLKRSVIWLDPGAVPKLRGRKSATRGPRVLTDTSTSFDFSGLTLPPRATLAK